MKDINKKNVTKVKTPSKLFGLFALLLVGAILTAGLANAYRGDFEAKGPYYNEERHEAMETAFENLDYTAWNELMTENDRHPRVVDVVTKENFARFVDAHEAMEAGDFDTAADIRAELGLNNGIGPKDGTGFMKGQGQHGAGMHQMQQNFVDSDNDGNCDNTGMQRGRK